MKIPTGCPSHMLCGWFAARSRSLRRFPLRARRALHHAVLNEILEERAVSGRGRQVPRGVKRKMSNYALRPRAPQSITRIDYKAAIKIAK